MLAGDWHNAIRPGDVNQDGTVSALDALQVVNELNAREFSDSEGVLAERLNEVSPFYDVNDDGLATALDALQVINVLGLGNPAPTLSIILTNDTGIEGDLVTSSLDVHGRATDVNNPITSISISSRGGPVQEIIPNADGTFAFTPSIATDGSDDGPVVLVATATDEGGANSQDVTLQVTLDTQAPVSPSLVLDPAFDSAPLGDSITDRPSVRLVGVTSPGAVVQIASLSATATADATGGFAFDNVALEEGSNAF